MRLITATPLLIFLVLLTGCKKEDSLPTPDPDPGPDPITYPYTVLDCEDLNGTTDFLNSLTEQNVYLKSIQKDSAHYLLTFENDSVYGLTLDCLTAYQVLPELWSLEISYSDGTTQSLAYIGTIEMQTELNPSGFAPLTAHLTVSAPVKGRVGIRVVGKNGPYSDVTHTFDSFESEQTVEILGLYPDYENLIEVTYLNETGAVRVKDSVLITTDVLHPDLPTFQIKAREENRMAAGMNLISYRYLITPNVPFMFDAYGDIRWYLNYEEHPTLNKLNYNNGIDLLYNGNLYFATSSDGSIYEVDFFGRVMNTWPIPDTYIYHHEVYEKSNGNFLVTVSYINSTHLNGNGANQDYLIEIDRETGALVMEWDLKQCLDEYRTTLKDNLSNSIVDWIHVNAVIEDETDNTLIVSARQQGVFKIDYDNQVKWIMGLKTGWGQNRYGQDLNAFLLTALDANGQPLDSIYQVGAEPYPDFDWPWYQHAPLLMPNGNLMIFDNGFNRNFNPDIRYSRAVEYVIDETNLTVTQAWHYGKERGLETFSGVASDVDFLPEANNVLFLPGVNVMNSNGEMGGKIVEIDYATGDVVFEAEINSPAITFTQAGRIRLYPD